MTAIKDPYPENLVDLGDPVAPLVGFTSDDALIRAVNRLAQAVEQNTLAILDRPTQIPQNAPQRPANLAALPSVQVVADKPACPFHGLEKVRTSDKGPGFYCSAKAQPGQPSNPRGYCTWHS